MQNPTEFITMLYPNAGKIRKKVFVLATCQFGFITDAELF